MIEQDNLDSTEQDLLDARRSSHINQAKLNNCLELFGDWLGKKLNYKLRGMDAIYLYLITKHHWTPAQVKGMKLEDIDFVLHVEQQSYPDGVFPWSDANL